MASAPHGVALVQLLGNPPPLEALKATGKTLTKYQEIPQTPPPRKHRLDSNLAIMQNKLEMAMQALVHSQETNEREPVAQAAAWIRSAWEDIHQQRRHLLAGRQSHKLDKRVDDTRRKLL